MFIFNFTTYRYNTENGRKRNISKEGSPYTDNKDEKIRRTHSYQCQHIANAGFFCLNIEKNKNIFSKTTNKVNNEIKTLNETYCNCSIRILFKFVPRFVELHKCMYTKKHFHFYHKN